MKKLRMITAVFAASAILAAMPLFAASAEGYSYEIAEENDLASWRYDWNTVEIGSGKTGFESGNLKMENINQGTANYALYKTNSTNFNSIFTQICICLPRATRARTEQITPTFTLLFISISTTLLSLRTRLWRLARGL